MSTTDLATDPVALEGSASAIIVAPKGSDFVLDLTKMKDKIVALGNDLSDEQYTVFSSLYMLAASSSNHLATLQHTLETTASTANNLSAQSLMSSQNLASQIGISDHLLKENSAMRAELAALREQKETSNAVLKEIYISKLSEIKWLSKQQCKGCNKEHCIYVDGKTSLFDMCNTRICYRKPATGSPSPAISTAKSRLATGRRSAPKGASVGSATTADATDDSVTNAANAANADKFDMAALLGCTPVPFVAQEDE